MGDPLTPADTAYVPLPPQRILDTRDGFGYSSKLSPMQQIAVSVLGQGGIPSKGASAVVLNLTVTEPTRSGYLTAFPSGVPAPTASNLNFVAGQTIPNLAVVKLGADGSIGLLNGSPGATHVVADVAGYFPLLPDSTPGAFTSLAPGRLLDSRTGSGQKLGPSATVDLTVVGMLGIPTTNVSAVVLNVTVTEPTRPGYITAYPTGGSPPLASNLNFFPGQTVPTLVTVKVGANGKVSFLHGSPGTSHLVVDAAGYFTTGSGALHSEYVSLPPQRVVDTRVVPFPVQFSLSPLGLAGVPSECVSAVVMNVTVTEPKGAGYLAVSAAGPIWGHVSNVNFTAGQTVGNLVIAKLSSVGNVGFYPGNVTQYQVVVDIEGYFTC